MTYQTGDRVSVFYNGGPRGGWNSGSVIREITDNGALFVRVMLDDGAETTGVTPDRVTRINPTDERLTT